MYVHVWFVSLKPSHALFACLFLFSFYIHIYISTHTPPTTRTHSNDIINPSTWIDGDPPQDHHVPLPEYKANYQKILTHLHTLSPSLPILLLTPPPIDDARAGPNGRLNQNAKKYRDCVLEIAEEERTKKENVHVFDLWKACEGENEGRLGEYLVDGLHLSGKGNGKVYEGIVSVIEREWPELAPGSETMPKQERDPWVH